jgi:hypothetical protein
LLWLCFLRAFLSWGILPQSQVLCVLLPGSFCTVIVVSTSISFIWRENGTKYSHQIEVEGNGCLL